MTFKVLANWPVRSIPCEDCPWTKEDKHDPHSPNFVDHPDIQKSQQSRNHKCHMGNGLTRCRGALDYIQDEQKST